jgi:hypothetical protein
LERQLVSHRLPSVVAMVSAEDFIDMEAVAL